MTSSATFSADRRYRYTLERSWDETKPPFVVIGLNPSTADETTDDPTIRRCIGFAKREGCGSLLMLNLFGFRATDPNVMRAAKDPIGDANLETIVAETKKAVKQGGKVVCAWGSHGEYRTQGEQVSICLRVPAFCFGKTKSGQPKHPLYLKANTPLEKYDPYRRFPENVTVYRVVA